ncbi:MULTISPECIES: hybrid sensor histidine kinase/response regulator [unclassified Nostoc]|uniref:hybrid sensor histidine kinase/response regulator n=1 Tax=unclassified Nostoc TaxID=2593658 RepID=UPI002AD35AB1|nr:hybrid sensor histidine kinase/response regulator [Nostoc sp. DedQUE03]MDZ7974986.1 hybrid sensor histidine kinase/response regulator [Nostoc sp. DedQUE03]MDZ8046621.1 hybrid sensor histidine kinase/response regulator [Nostoc sp. DedQUE02]
MNNYNLLDLFCQEIETQVSILKESLTALRTQPSSLTDLEQATQAVHSIWGSAKLVEREAGANLAQIMKECFIAAQNSTITLGDEQIDLLLHSCHLLLSIGKAAEVEFARWMSEHSWELSTTQKALSIFLASGTTNISFQKPENQEGITSILSPVSSPATSSSLELAAIATETVSQSSISSLQEPEEPKINFSLNTWEEAQSIFIPNTSAQEIAPITVAASEKLTTRVSDDGSMMDLFRLELETQVNLMNQGLLALENNPKSAQALETLMRAAHSIKGSARIVALDAVVNLAHVMEDCFVAAQNKKITLNSDHVDILLSGVDLLQGISQVSNAELPNWLANQNAVFMETQLAVTAILNPQAAPLPAGEVSQKEAKTEISAFVLPSLSQVTPELIPLAAASLNQSPSSTEFSNHQQVSYSSQEKNLPSSATSASEQTPAQDRVVRVSAENLNRIMGLAGESLIEANWLQPHADSMMSLKWRLVELSRTLERLQNTLDQGNYEQDGKQYLEEARHKEEECVNLLSDRLNELELYAQRTANLSDRLYREVITSNMRPFADGIQGFPRMIRDLARKLNKEVKLEIVGKATSVDRDILKKLEAPLTHILRNATDHGIELPQERIAVGKPSEGTIRLEAFHRGGMLAITISDDGRGINLENLRQKIINKNLATSEMAAQFTDAELMEFLFLPGFSTAKQVTEISGRGVGLDIAKSMAQEVGGTVRAVSHAGKGTSFHFQLPLTLSVVRTLLVEISGNPYAVPLARIEQIVTVEQSEIAEVENRQYFTMNQQNIGLIAAHQVLELPKFPDSSGSLSVVIISDQASTYGLVVDKFLGERDLVVRPLDSRLGKVRDISATSLLGDGSPVLIVDVSDMVRTIDNILNIGQLNKVRVETAAAVLDKRQKILVVDDSITVREMERKLLENRGYNVDIAVNGVEGWNAVRTNHYDLVISDIDMPRMNGIELVRQIKSHPRLHSLPVIIVSYRDRTEDRIQGLEAGADYYLTKSSFHDSTLLDAVVDLIGR